MRWPGTFPNLGWAAWAGRLWWGWLGWGAQRSSPGFGSGDLTESVELMLDQLFEVALDFRAGLGRAWAVLRWLGCMGWAAGLR